MAFQLVTAATEPAISLTEAKEHLREDGSDQDNVIEALVLAATDAVQQYTGRALLDQTYDFYLDEFPTDGGPIELPRPPLIEVVGVFYRDSAGDEQEWDAANYIVDTASIKARVALPSSGSWPTAATRINAVRIRFRAGYLNEAVSPAEANVPAGLIAAVKFTLAHWYANRETAVVGVAAAEVPLSATWLMKMYRVETGMG